MAAARRHIGGYDRGGPTGTHSLPRNSLTTDAISYLVVSHPPLYRSCFKFRGLGSVLHIVVRYTSYVPARGYARRIFRRRIAVGTRARRTRERALGRGANCSLSISLLHAPLYGGVYLYILDEYMHPKFGSFSKTPKSRLSLGSRIG